MATHFYGSEFFGGEFFFGGAPVVVIDTHDGFRKRKRWEEQREARERLRRQILDAIDGPQAEHFREEVAPRIIREFEFDTATVDRVALRNEIMGEIDAAWQKFLDDDDEDVLLLI